MKNLKVRVKLILSFGVVIGLALIIIIFSGIGLVEMRLQQQTLVDKVFVNTNYVGEMRRNLLSEGKYISMAVMESDPAVISEHLQKIEDEVLVTEQIMVDYKANSCIESSKLDKLEKLMADEKASREKFHTLLLTGSQNDKGAAYQIYIDELSPLLDDHGLLLKDIGDEQALLADKQVKDTNALFITLMIALAIATLLGLIASIVMIILLSKAILNPLKEIETATKALRRGDFSVAITYDSHDEFGQTCNALQESFTELKRIISITASMLNKLAEGDFSQCPVANFPGETAAIENAGNAFIKKMNNFISEIKTSANQIQVGSDQVASGSQALAQGATEQASSIEELSASLTVVSDKVNTNAENSKKANDLASTAGNVAQATLKDMDEMLTAMDAISRAATNISKVIKVIDDITFQTNILSLNAAVEAARAGVAGKGFAVVANEVKNLAQKSSESAKEITALIEDAISSVNQGEQIAQQTSKAFNELSEEIHETVAFVNEIALASEEQSESIQQITVGVDQISAVVQTNSATSEESAASSEELSGQANALNSLVAQFKLMSDTDMIYSSSEMESNFQDVAQSNYGSKY